MRSVQGVGNLPGLGSQGTRRFVDVGRGGIPHGGHRQLVIATGCIAASRVGLLRLFAQRTKSECTIAAQNSHRPRTTPKFAILWTSSYPRTPRCNRDATCPADMQRPLAFGSFGTGWAVECSRQVLFDAPCHHFQAILQSPATFGRCFNSAHAPNFYRSMGEAKTPNSTGTSYMTAANLHPNFGGFRTEPSEQSFSTLRARLGTAGRRI